MLSRDERRPAVLVFLAAMALYALTAGGSLTSSDAVVTFELTRSLVEHQSIALSRNILGSSLNQGRDGRYYSQFGIGQSLYNIPFYLAGRAAVALVGRPIGKPDTVPKAVVAMGSAVAAAIAVSLVWVLGFRLTADARAALIAASGVAVGSPLWPYSKFGFSTALTAAIVVATACLLWTAARGGRTRDAFLAGLVMAFGWLTRHEMALALIPFSIFLVVDGRQRHTARPSSASLVLAFLLAAGTGGVFWMIYNLLRFGSPTFVGYVPRFGTEGFAAFLVAPAGSVFLFCPLVIVWIAGLLRVRSVGMLLLLAGPLLVFYLFFGALADWPGGRSYGPRYLVPALVLLGPALALSIRGGAVRPKIAMLLVAVAAVLQLPGVLVDYSKVSLDWAQSAARQEIEERNWHMSSSPLVLNAKAASRRVPDNAAYLTGRSPQPETSITAGEEDRGFAQQFSFSLDFWWLYLIYLGVIGAGTGLTAALLLLIGAVGCAVSAWHATSAIPQVAH